jgi:histone-lysine N-methyltransferase SETMAR
MAVLSKRRLLLSECVLLCRHENVRTNIKFLVKLGKGGSETREMLVQVYRDNAMKKTAVHKWVICFSEGRESVTDEERSGWPATNRTEENIAKICQIVRENWWLTVRSIAEQANIDRETVSPANRTMG